MKGQAKESRSMGMTGALEVAIEEGATMICVGTALFGVWVGPPPSRGGTGVKIGKMESMPSNQQTRRVS